MTANADPKLYVDPLERHRSKPTYEAKDTHTLADGKTPIPYIAMWTDEIEDERIGTKVDRGVHDSIPVFCDDVARGGGRVILGATSIERQRWAVIYRRCQICAKPLGRTSFAVEIFDGAVSVQYPETRIVGRYRERRIFTHTGPAVREPPTCAACMALSLEVCPGLWRAMREGAHVLALRQDSYAVALTVAEFPELGEEKNVKAITYAKIVPLPNRCERLTVPKFLERVGR